jgi:RNA methyltransferase, TrmH family
MVAFQIKSLQHSIVKHCVNLRKDPHYRREHGSVLIMGKKQIFELPSDIKILNMFTLDNINPIKQAKNHYTVTEDILKKITGLNSPEPYAAEVAYPNLKAQTIKRLLVCDAISDPGNLGTLLRTALSFGFDAAYLLHDCVDPFNEKVIRSAKGALFHLPLLHGDWNHLLSIKEKFSLELYQADMGGTPMTECLISTPFGLILGNEAHGTSKQAKEYAHSISIPMTQKTNSLNVAIAGGILMFNTSALCQK